MNNRTPGLITISLAIVASIIACVLPGVAAPTPFAQVTPNLTMTAIFQYTQVIPPTITTGPVVFTATPKAGPTETLVPTILVPSPTWSAMPTNTQSAVEPSSTTALQPTATPKAPPAPTQTPDYSGPGKRGGPELAAVYQNTAPEIDGDLVEWTIGLIPASEVVYGKGNWEGEADLSSTVVLGWDDDYLYLAARINDDVYVQNATGRTLFMGDSIEILVDVNVSQDYYQQRLNSDDFQLGISPGKSKFGENFEAYLWYPTQLEGPRTNVKISGLKTQSGYQLEVAIPWSIFGINPKAGQHYGFAFSVSDNDMTGSSIQQSMVSNVNTRNLVDPTSWGGLTLKAP